MAPKLELGTPDDPAILESGLLKIGDPPPEGHQVAMIVNHGIRQQVPHGTSTRLP
jgi:hypothetical protein